MEAIRKINKLLLISYNIGGICLIIIGKMTGIGASPGYLPGWLKVVTGMTFVTILLAHSVRYILEKRTKKVC